MNSRRIHLIALLIGLALFSWPMMMLVHEAGHMLGALMTGGSINRLVWHPLAFSRTDISPNPQPLLVVWSGPVIGVLIPVILERVARMFFAELNYIFKLFAGFCLIANGCYIGFGVFDRAGDAGDMLRLGTPAWIMIAFGILATVLGFWLWHRASFRPGLGHHPSPQAIPAWHAYGTLAIGVLVVVLAFAFADRGP